VAPAKTYLLTEKSFKFSSTINLIKQYLLDITHWIQV